MDKDAFEEINCDKAAGALYELLMKKAWINSGGVMTPADADSEMDSALFLISLATNPEIDGWGHATPPVRRVVNSLMLDFLAKLMHPNGPFVEKTWRVPSNLPSWRQALFVIAHEIQRSHPHLVRPH
ncbi:hypothetical protein [Herbaspirillum sp. ST 5-3]|uniref:hypothetical protein n=1 Tax=Oxalobacteraceae TaxID=75682 RepID=UPI0010A3396A|nr:hypothetical protein [Herbaspirillum sp. ST 5-3]